MKVTCEKIEEAIWNYARDGVEFSDEVRRHIEACNSCRDAFVQIEVSHAAIRCMKPHPQSPDCRQQVQLQISKRRPAMPRRFVWAAIPAVIAVVLVVGLYATSHLHDIRQAKNTTSPSKTIIHHDIGRSTGDVPAKVAVVHPPNRSSTTQVAKAYKINRRQHSHYSPRHKTTNNGASNNPAPTNMSSETNEKPVVMAVNGEISARFSKKYLAEKGVPADALKPSGDRQSRVVLMAKLPDGYRAGYTLSSEGDVTVSDLKPGTYDLALQVRSQEDEQIEKVIPIEKSVTVYGYTIASIDN